MFNNGPFYFSIIRKMVILFGNCFNDLYIERTDSDGNVSQLIKVPIEYAQKNKLLARVDADPEIQRLTAVQLPRMSFEMLGMQYDEDRKLNKMNRHAAKNATDADKLKAQYSPVPYNFAFRLYVYVKNVEDGTKIIEQIVPWFEPDWTLTVNLVPEANEIRDIPIVLNGSPSFEDNYDGQYAERRRIIWTLDFTVKGYLYGPVKNTPIIKFSNMNFYVPAGSIEEGRSNTDIIGSIQVKPGLTANGQPTTNAAAAVNTHTIQIDDDFGYITTITGSVYLNGS